MCVLLKDQRDDQHGSDAFRSIWVRGPVLNSEKPPSYAGAARLTVLMVKLGFLDLVRDIVAKLAQQDRSDVVSKVRPAYRIVACRHLLALVAVYKCIAGSRAQCELEDRYW